MTFDLTALTILVTRPDPQGRSLCHLIDRAGGKAIFFPTIAFEPPHDLDAFHHTIKQLGQCDWLIFISPQAVYATVPLLRRVSPILPPKVKFAAVGKGTARALERAGYNPERYPLTNEGSEGLLTLPIFHHPAGLHIAVIRGEGGRELLDNEFKARGAKVTTLIAYQRVMPPHKEKPDLSRIHIIVCTSFEGVQNLKTLYGDAQWEALRRKPLCVFSERIKKLANDLGFATIGVTKEMSDEGILQALAQMKEML